MSQNSTVSPPTLFPASAIRKKRLRDIFGRDWSVAYIFVLPMTLIMVGLILWPLINAVLISTTSLNFLTGETVNVGFKNFIRLWSNNDYWQSIDATIRFTAWSLTLKFATGMTIALLLNSRLPYRKFMSGLMLLPWVVPEIVTALAWRSIYDPINGGLNPILMGLGITDKPLGWLSDPNLAMPSIIAVNIWKGIPFYVLLLLAGLKAIDREQLDAAHVDGANAIQRFRYIVLPGLRYVIAVTLLLSFITTFNQFGLVFLMTGGGPGATTKLYSILAYEKAIAALQYGPGSAIALSVAPLMAILIWLLSKFMRSEDRTTTKSDQSGIGDKLMRLFASSLNFILDVLFWPINMLARIFETFNRRLVRHSRQNVNQKPILLKAQIHFGFLLKLILIVAILAFVLFPFYWIFVTSFKTTAQIAERSSIFWPAPFTLEQFQSLLGETAFLRWFFNSVFVAAATTILSIALASLAAYALSRLRFKGAGLLMTFLLITYLLPATLLFIPLFQTLSTLGLINSYSALILTYPTFLLPFATWILIGYFRSIPVELEEAALVDGASRLYIYWKIMLPLASPAIVSVGLIAFTTAWNEFLFAFVFINSESLRTLPIGLQSMVVGDILPWGELMAASLLTAIPVGIVYIYAQKFLVGGLTIGGVKG